MTYRRMAMSDQGPYSRPLTNENGPLWAELAHAASLRELDENEWTEAFRSLANELLDNHRSMDQERLRVLLRAFVRRSAERGREGMSEALRSAIERGYHASGSSSPVRYQLLLALAHAGGRGDISLWTELIIGAPPDSEMGGLASFLPIARHPGAPGIVFPRLLDGLAHRSLAAAILDLANFFTRQQFVDEHPASARRDDLMKLLRQVTSRLREVQTAGPKPAQATATQVAECVTLVISLCDALALIGDERAQEPISAIAELKHRRLRVEALAAMFRLGDQDAAESLIDMASEPSVRLRVLKYADELGFEERIPDDKRTPVAIAEAELVSWLSEPTQMGIPPSRCELVEQRTLYWPGYDEPRTCYLFRYTYTVVGTNGASEMSGIGIAGPVCMSFHADLGNLPIPEIYAIFAGWHVEHPEIVDTYLPAENTHVERFVAELQRHLEDRGHDEIQPVILSDLFGDKVLVARARKMGRRGLVGTDSRRIFWVPVEGISRPLDAEHVLYLHRGKRLLRAFNDGWS